MALERVPASLSDLQRQVLLVLVDSGKSETPTDIAYEMGFQPFSARGKASRMFSPAQKIIGPLVGLRKRGLVVPTGRRDGRSGTAYVLTAEGKRIAEVLAMRRDTPTCGECGAPVVEGNVSAMWHPPKYPEAPGLATGNPVPAAVTYTCANGHEWTRSVDRGKEP